MSLGGLLGVPRHAFAKAAVLGHQKFLWISQRDGPLLRRTEMSLDPRHTGNPNIEVGPGVRTNFDPGLLEETN